MFSDNGTNLTGAERLLCVELERLKGDSVLETDKGIPPRRGETPQKKDQRREAVTQAARQWQPFLVIRETI
jgi:hypothetical protein